MTTFPKKPIYLLYGNEEEKLNEDRCSIVEMYLPREKREENYREFTPKASQTRLPLASFMPELLAELGTISFFPDSCRVIVIYNLAELYGRKASSDEEPSEDSPKLWKGKVSPEVYFIKYLEKELPDTSNILIFQNTEDPDKNLRVNEKGNIFKTITKSGHKIKHFSNPINWRLEDAIMKRNLPEALNILRQWMEKDPDTARSKVFQSLVKRIVLLLQAKVITAKKKKIESVSELEETLFPDGMTYNLLNEHPWIQSKIEEGSARYTMTELTRALQKTLEIGTYVFPKTTDVYVPDMQIVYERFLVEFLSGASEKKKLG
jgi:DNA polymerase III delta subunit